MSDSAFGDLLGGLGTPDGGSAGWFGKLASLGDFAHRRLPQNFVDVLDDWLSKGMEASRGQLGDEWLDVYLTGPLWRFALSPGVVDARWWFGVLMPSVDKVGRYFPLVVARGTPIAPESVAGLAGLHGWYRQVSAAVLDTLQPQATIDTFEAALGRAQAWPESLPERRPDVAHLPGRDRYTLPGDAPLAQWGSAFGLREAMQVCAGKSLWWPDHANTSDTSLSISHGLPEPGQFALLLEGEW